MVYYMQNKYSIKNYTKIFLSVWVAALLLGGCSSKNFNADFKEFSDGKFESTKSPNYVKDSIKEISNDKRQINLDNVKRVSIALEHLGNIDGKSYILSNDSEDIFLHPIKESHKLGINSFDKLNQYIQDTSNYVIYVKKNRFLKDRVKVVAVKNKDIFKKDLSNIPFSLEGKASVAEVIEQLRFVSGFNVIAKHIPVENKKTAASLTKNDRLFDDNSVANLFENNYISFAGNNIMELLNYISNSFNIYVDVDYENKLIVFKKLKSRLFSINLNNVEYSGSLDVKKQMTNDVGQSGDESKSIKTKVKLDILDSLDKSIQAILEKSTNESVVYTFNKTVGSIYVKADKETMKEVALIIDNFNNVFDKQIDFQLEIFEFAVTKEFDAGIALGATINTTQATGSLATKSITDSIFNLTENTASNGVTKSITGATLDNKTVKLVKQTRHGYILKNSIPYFVDVTDSRSYIKSITQETTVTSGVSKTTVTPETSEINEGTVLSVLSKINGNNIEFNIQPKIIKVNGVTTATFDTTTISLPDLSTNTFSSNVILKDGERKVIGYITTYEDVNDYNGVVPIDNFILGGARSKKYFRKETVFVVNAKIR